MTTAVSKKKSTDVATFDYGEDTGAGFENQTADDLSIPFLSVLQALSPQVQDPEDGGIDGARPGSIFNTVTEDVTSGKDGLLFVPASKQHVFVEWVPRDSGGGFVGIHDPSSDEVRRAKANAQEFGRYRSSAGNDLIETHYLYGVVCDEDGSPGEMAVIAFTSTKISVLKKFNTRVYTFRIKTPDGRKVAPPLFAHMMRIKTTKQKNNHGEFFNFDLSPAKGTLAESLLSPDSEAFTAAKACKEMVEGGLARASYESQNSGDSSGAGDEEAPF